MKRKVKITLWSVSAVLLIVMALCIGAGSYMVDYALAPKSIGPEKEAADRAKLDKSYPRLEEWLDSLENAGILRDTTIVDDEGWDIMSYYAEADRNVGKTAVIVHGWTSNPMQMMMIARMFRDSLGYNIMVPALNCHAGSEGDAIQMGWKDRIDVEQWSAVAHEMFADTLQVIHGISMGAATTMMVSGDDLPEYVRGFIEDCGYSSVWDQFKKELKGQFGLPTFPVLNSADFVCRCRYGWGFKEASSVDQLAKCDRPMLFIHGDADDFVLTENVYRNYDAKVNGYREMWITEGSKHARSYADHTSEYVARVRTFLSDHVER